MEKLQYLIRIATILKLLLLLTACGSDTIEEPSANNALSGNTETENTSIPESSSEEVESVKNTEVLGTLLTETTNASNNIEETLTSDESTVENPTGGTSIEAETPTIEEPETSEQGATDENHIADNNVDNNNSNSDSNDSTPPPADDETLPSCGNAFIELGESCDDGNLISGDGCNDQCQHESACSTQTPETGAISEYFDRFNMPIERHGCTTLHRPHSIRRWSMLYTGRCAGCGIPSRISSAAFNNTLIVSWIASADYADSESVNTRRFGHLSTFTFTEDEGFKKVNDFVYKECDYDMGSVTVSPDGSVIGALCLSNREDSNAQNDVYLYEWLGGEITQTPDLITKVSSAAGGVLKHGHWGLSLNNDQSYYYMALATVTKDGRHQGMSRFSFNRSTLEKKHGQGCGAHPNSNRIVHNRHDDTWSVFCRAGQKTIHWAFVDPTEFANQFTSLGAWEFTNLKVTPGGLHNGISLGHDGWLVAATGPFDLFEGVSSEKERKTRLQSQQIGLRHLPNDLQTFKENDNDYPWHWIPLEKVCKPTKSDSPRLAGMVQLHNWGAGGEHSGRVLMSYSPTRGHTQSKEFHVVEVDTSGNLLHDPVVLHRGGWGIDSLGTHMPGSGCVVFPLTSVPDDPEGGIGGSYPKIEQSVTQRSAFLKLTAVCPSRCDARTGECDSSFTAAEPREAVNHQPQCPTL